MSWLYFFCYLVGYHSVVHVLTHAFPTLRASDLLDAGPKCATVAFHNNAFANPVGLIAFIQKQAGEVKLRPDHTLVYRRAWETDPARVKGVQIGRAHV